MILLKLTEEEIDALNARVERLRSATDRALMADNDAKAERLTDKADALDAALWCIDDGSVGGFDGSLFSSDDHAVIVEALKREREHGNL